MIKQSEFTFKNDIKSKSNVTSPNKISHWLGRILSFGFSFLLRIPFSIVKILASMFIPTKETNTTSLKEKTIEPIQIIVKKETEEALTDPLDLSSQEIILFTSGLFLLAASTTGLPYGLQWLEKDYWRSCIFQSSINTLQTTPISILFPLILPFLLPSKSHPQENQFSNAPFNFAFGIAPYATLVQTQLSYRQTKKALTGIKTCIDHIGKKDSWTIARNLFVHSFNIATSGANFLISAKISRLEFLSYASQILQYTTSEEHAFKMMGSICPAPFSKSAIPLLKETATLFEKVNFLWENTYKFLIKPIGLCHPIK